MPLTQSAFGLLQATNASIIENTFLSDLSGTDSCQFYKCKLNTRSCWENATSISDFTVSLFYLVKDSGKHISKWFHARAFVRRGSYACALFKPSMIHLKTLYRAYALYLQPFSNSTKKNCALMRNGSPPLQHFPVVASTLLPRP